MEGLAEASSNFSRNPCFDTLIAVLKLAKPEVVDRILNVYLWGSRAYGVATPTSDYDIMEPEWEKSTRSFLFEDYSDEILNVHFISAEFFLNLLREHRHEAMSCNYLPGKGVLIQDSFVWQKKMLVDPLSFEPQFVDRVHQPSPVWPFLLSPEPLRIDPGQYSRTIAWESRTRFSIGISKQGRALRKDMIHAFRYALFAQYLIAHSADERLVIEPTLANRVFEEVMADEGPAVSRWLALLEVEMGKVAGVRPSERRAHRTLALQHTHRPTSEGYKITQSRPPPLPGITWPSYAKISDLRPAADSSTQSRLLAWYRQFGQPGLLSLGCLLQTHPKYPELVHVLYLPLDGRPYQRHWFEQAEAKGLILDPDGQVVCAPLPHMAPFPQQAFTYASPFLPSRPEPNPPASTPITQSQAIRHAFPYQSTQDSFEVGPQPDPDTSLSHFELLDGITVHLFHYDNHWEASTPCKPVCPPEFWDTWHALGYSLDKANPQLTYTFNLIVPELRFTVWYQRPAIVLLGAIRNTDYVELDPAPCAAACGWQTLAVLPPVDRLPLANPLRCRGFVSRASFASSSYPLRWVHLHALSPEFCSDEVGCMNVHPHADDSVLLQVVRSHNDLARLPPGALRARAGEISAKFQQLCDWAEEGWGQCAEAPTLELLGRQLRSHPALFLYVQMYKIGTLSVRQHLAVISATEFSGVIVKLYRTLTGRHTLRMKRNAAQLFLQDDFVIENLRHIEVAPEERKKKKPQEPA